MPETAPEAALGMILSGERVTNAWFQGVSVHFSFFHGMIRRRCCDPNNLSQALMLLTVALCEETKFSN
jgi:hypothetical protein